MYHVLVDIARSRAYWLFLITLGISLEGVALYYQYALEYWPCVLCIHVRILVFGIILVAGVALCLRRSRLLRSLMHVLMSLLMAVLVERAWILIGVERGTIEGSCSMDSGLPGWLALDRWFPFLFKIWEPCGYTPELLAGITMAEALLVLFSLLLAVSVILTLASVRDRRGA